MLHHADAPPCLLACGESPRRLVSCCRTDVFDDCAAPRLFVDIVKLPLKPPPLCVSEFCGVSEFGGIGAREFC